MSGMERVLQRTEANALVAIPMLYHKSSWRSSTMSAAFSTRVEAWYLPTVIQRVMASTRTSSMAGKAARKALRKGSSQRMVGPYANKALGASLASTSYRHSRRVPVSYHSSRRKRRRILERHCLVATLSSQKPRNAPRSVRSPLVSGDGHTGSRISKRGALIRSREI